MRQVEISFPRGKPSYNNYFGTNSDPSGSEKIKKKKRASDSVDVTHISSNDNDDLFKISRSTPSVPKKKKKSIGLTSEETDLLISGSKADKIKTVVDSLSFETISEGLLSLGRVIRIRDHEILVSLPGRTMGSVPITAISGPYTKALEKLTLAEGREDAVYGVKDLFQIGQIVSVAVTGVKKDVHSVRVTLSMSPSDLQAGYTSGSISESMVLTGAVESVEDHGYIIDIGVQGTHTFLPKENAKAFIQNVNHKPLGIGQLLKCKVLKSKSAGRSGTSKTYLTVTISPKEVNRTKYTMETVNNYQLLLPGMESEGTVMETHKTGIKVDFLGMVSLIHLDHMAEPWTLPGTLEVGATNFPRVLYLFPNSSNPYLTLQSRICQKKASLPQLLLTLGDKLKVKIARIEKRGLIVKFENGERGFVSSTRCSDNSAFTDEDIAREFPIASSHTCCVMEYSSLDNIYIGSFQQSVLSQQIIRIDQLEVGQVVSCDLKAWKSTGAIVGVGLAKGFIPKIHFGELALKNPAVKFPVGHKFKARVCRIDLNKNQILLTAKKRLVKSKAPLLSSYPECVYGIESEGVISKVTESGLNIFTIGGLSAFIPATKATKESRTRLTKLFFPGQVVNFHVVSANAEKNRIILSMLFEESSRQHTSSSNEVITGGKENKQKLKNGKQSAGGHVIEIINKSVKVIPEDVVVVKPTTNRRKISSEDKSKVSLENKETKSKSRKLTTDKTKSKDNPEPPRKRRKKHNSEQDTHKDVPKRSEIPCLEVPSESFYDTSYLIKGGNESDSDVSSVEEYETEEIPKTVKAVKKDKASKEWAHESEIRKIESKVADPLHTPTTLDDFERLVINSPNSSLAWTAFIAFVLQGADIANARALAARALQTILFREEGERLNIWKVMLNMETGFGTEESVKHTFNEALKANDPLAIYKAMCEIRQRAKNYKELEYLLRVMNKKFPQEREVWFLGLTHYYKTGQFDKGRELFKTCLANLPKTEHITMISKTAVLEMKYGDVGRGRTLLDTTLLTYPKRLDLWLLYAAQLIKKGNYDDARDVFQNAARVPFVPKRMLVVLKKFLQFEMEHGTLENRSKVKEMALQYVNNVDASAEFLTHLDD